jgi:hypothetical protein
MRRVLPGAAQVPLQIEELHALVELIEWKGIADPHLAAAHEKLGLTLDGVLEAQVKRIIGLTRVA